MNSLKDLDRNSLWILFFYVLSAVVPFLFLPIDLDTMRLALLLSFTSGSLLSAILKLPDPFNKRTESLRIAGFIASMVFLISPLLFIHEDWVVQACMAYWVVSLISGIMVTGFFAYCEDKWLVASKSVK